MKIQFLGSGSAFALSKENYNSNILFTCDKETLLYDAGTSIGDSLDSVNLKPQDIDNIFISHLHADHCGGIEYLAQKTFFEVYKFGFSEFGCMKPNLISAGNILEDGWKKVWKGGLEYINEGQKTLNNYFKIINVKEYDFFNVNKSTFLPIKTKHTNNMESFGLMIYSHNKSIFLSGDTQFDRNLFIRYEDSDIIFQDCEFAEYPGGVHAQFHQLCKLSPEIKEKMWLYHYKLENKTFKELENKVINNGFAGLVKRKQEFKI